MQFKTFVVSDENYLDNTYLSIRSYFEYNTFPLTLYTFCDLDNPKLDRFKEIKGLTIEHLDRFNVPLQDGYQYYKDTIDFICAKLYIIDQIKNDYDCCAFFDTDTYFKGRIDELFVEQDHDLVGVSEMWRHFDFRKTPYLNCGLMVLKLKNIGNIVDEFFKFLDKFKNRIWYPEQDFLCYYIKDRGSLQPHYNFMPNYYFEEGLLDTIRMVHYAYPEKPFKISQNCLTDIISRGYIKFYDEYYALVEKYSDNLSLKFIEDCHKISKKLNIARLYYRRMYG